MNCELEVKSVGLTLTYLNYSAQEALKDQCLSWREGFLVT